jgi:nitrogen-specific signal transduction histidine kinase
MEPSSSDNGVPPGLSLPEGLVRTLRHEIGDFLQTVYSSAAILQARLPSSSNLERTVVANLRARAEACKHLLDTVHDVVFPITLTPETVMLADVAARLVADAVVRYPHLDIRAEAERVPAIRGDGSRLVQAGNWLLENACQSARSQVRFRTVAGPAPRQVSWIVTDDGPAVAAEQVEHLFDTFITSRRGTLALGLGPVRKIVTLHGGRVEATSGEGGFSVRVILPEEPPELEN